METAVSRLVTLVTLVSLCVRVKMSYYSLDPDISQVIPDRYVWLLRWRQKALESTESRSKGVPLN